MRSRVAAIVLAFSALAVTAGAVAVVSWLDAAYAPARSLGRGVNLGNVLEAPREGDWGLSLKAELFDRIKEAGFDTVRLPVRWSNHAEPVAPYRIDEAFFRRVDFAVEEALRRNLKIVVNMHHYRQLDGDPLDRNEQRVEDAVVEERFVAMWRQIAARYGKADPAKLFFELYNEPHNRLSSERWNALLRKGLETVRAASPRRYVIIGPVNYNKVEALPALSVPWHDRRIIVTIHVYDPYEFTHQGAAWVSGSQAWLNTRCCTEEQGQQITQRLDAARDWSRRTRRPIWVGEFGSYGKADYESRVVYTRFAREAIEARGFTWAYWELASAFGIFDPMNDRWRTELKDALLGRSGSSDHVARQRHKEQRQTNELPGHPA